MKYFLLSVLFISAFFIPASAQKKYPSLFWEITGNGLQKPSYLFGTMHVSSKMVFNLSDSFYNAMRRVDAVALEINPELWQKEMFKVQAAQTSLAKFSASAMNDYVKEGSFKLQKYEDHVKRALVEEPTVVNSLLYRSYQTTADFEENTYLDLYIYQTGRKLGKMPAGVEDYIESEKLMLEASQDMAKEKVHKAIDLDGQSPYQIQSSIQDAYRKGDLDLMDSLENLTNYSVAFTEKFLYKRNEIQANSIDTILQKRSLFVGVGAAHLPGPRGVIELLRKKGYHLRPILMLNRNAVQKDEIDKLKVPVTYKNVTTEDGLITMQLPGDFYKREESRINDSWQYADMNNGSYYMLTRVQSHAGMFGQNIKTTAAKIDSMLYENIPGKIIKKTSIVKDGFPAFDITNRTRRGDMQRYQIIVTPYEVLVFKMSGNDNYVDGKEAETFFNSIKIHNPAPQNNWVTYRPSNCGFTVKFPQQPHIALNKNTADRINRMEYEAVDNKTGNNYLLWRQSVYNLNFIEEDTFDLGLIEESLKRSEAIDKTISRRVGVENNTWFIEAKYSLKDGAFLTAKAFIKGPNYYLLAARSKDKKADVSTFLNSFCFSNYTYPQATTYTDPNLNVSVVTAVKPIIDSTIRQWVEKANNDSRAALGFSPSYPGIKNGIFTNDSTGEAIMVSVETFPKYYYNPDTAKFWRDRIEVRDKKDMEISSKASHTFSDSSMRYDVAFTDTNSSRKILATYILNGNCLYKCSTVTDTFANQSRFIKDFFATVKPINKTKSPSIFRNKLDIFFADYNSKDSVVSKEARDALSSLYYGKEGVDKIINAIKDLRYSDKDYLDLKSRFIADLGYIDDIETKQKLVVILKELYENSADTSYFQNAILKALARLKTKESYNLLKQLLVQDPPVFESSYEYSHFFSLLNDTLSLSKNLFPELLQLASIDDYKPHVNRLLKLLVDSGFIKSADYNTYFSKLYFDAKIELKKQQTKDEKKLQEQTANSFGDNAIDFALRNILGEVSAGASRNSSLSEYAALLAPFYNQFSIVPKFFDKLLQSKDVDFQLAAARALLVNGQKIPDSLMESIASKDEYRVTLLTMLEKIGKQDLFPIKYKSQDAIARSILLSSEDHKSFAAFELMNKELVQTKGDKGFLFLYKYKINKDDDWKMGISGIQPFNDKEVSTKEKLVKLTDKRLKPNEPAKEQFDQQVRRLLFMQHKSAGQFYNGSGLGMLSMEVEE